MTIDTAVLADLQAGLIHLDRGGHETREQGHCAMEVVAWLAGERHGDSPACTSPILSRYLIRLNDHWDDEQRQDLAPYLPRVIGTAGDGQDGARIEIAQRAIATDLLPAWLRLAGMDAEADALASVPLADLREHLESLSSATWARRSEALASIRRAVRAKMAGPAAVVVVAVAVAAAAAADAAVAAADVVVAADAAAAAAAAADAAAVAAVAADADAAAVAADAAAVAAAAADAAAAAADVVADASDPWGVSYTAALNAARPIFERAIREGTAPKLVAIRELAAAQRTVALDVLDRMIKPEVSR